MSSSSASFVSLSSLPPEVLSTCLSSDPVGGAVSWEGGVLGVSVAGAAGGVAASTDGAGNIKVYIYIHSCLVNHIEPIVNYNSH